MYYSLTFLQLYVFLFQLSWNLKYESVDHGIDFVVNHCNCFAVLGYEVPLNEDCGNIAASFSSEIDGKSSPFLVSSVDLRHCQKVFAPELSAVFSSSEILAL